MTTDTKKEHWFFSYLQTFSICITIIGTVFGSTCWMNGKFNEIDAKFHQVDLRFYSLDKQFSEIHEQIAVIKTVLLMKNILPSELAKDDK